VGHRETSKAHTEFYLWKGDKFTARSFIRSASRQIDSEFLGETNLNGNANNATQWGTEKHRKHILSFICGKEINPQQGAS